MVTAPPRILAIDSQSPDPRVIGEAVSALRAGRLVAFPTETVYGLGARALDEAALARVFAAKGRPTHHPLIAHVTGEGEARRLAAAWPPAAARLARALWPGPLTLVVERAAQVPAAVAGGADSIAVRAPAHPVARALIAALGEPIAAPSANRYQGLSPTTAAHVVRQLGAAVDLVLDGGSCAAGIESTVVDVRGSRPRVLRPGATPAARLRALVPDLELRPERASHDAPRASPGMGARHYAPRARLHIAATSEVAALIDACAGAGLLVGAVTHSDAAWSGAKSARVIERRLAAEPEAYASRLYATLHDFDDRGVDVVVVEAVPEGEAWWAIDDRLRRATAVE
jgi:L-threonylcarbamoyladenylate synthase